VKVWKAIKMGIVKQSLVVLLLCTLVSCEGTAVQSATESATKWLALVDGGNFAVSWNEAAQYFKNAVSKEEWVKMLQAHRLPLGAVKSRKLKSATYKTSVPGAPDGKYVVIRFESSFENKKEATETVTPMLDKDGQWRVSGYFIK
jgi:hypothetical protein